MVGDNHPIGVAIAQETPDPLVYFLSEGMFAHASTMQSKANGMLCG